MISLVICICIFLSVVESTLVRLFCNVDCQYEFEHLQTQFRAACHSRSHALYQQGNPAVPVSLPLRAWIHLILLSL